MLHDEDAENDAILDIQPLTIYMNERKYVTFFSPTPHVKPPNIMRSSFKSAGVRTFITQTIWPSKKLLQISHVLVIQQVIFN